MKLTQEQKNQRLCEWAITHGVEVSELHDGTGRTLFESLDAVHELEMQLGNSANPTAALWWQYIEILTIICGDVPAIFATAAQRAEALGLTLGLWKEGE